MFGKRFLSADTNISLEEELTRTLKASLFTFWATGFRCCMRGTEWVSRSAAMSENLSSPCGWSMACCTERLVEICSCMKLVPNDILFQTKARRASSFCRLPFLISSWHWRDTLGDKRLKTAIDTNKSGDTPFLTICTLNSLIRWWNS